MLTPIDGCEHCGEPLLTHCVAWDPTRGWHGFVAPTAETRQRRERARVYAAQMKAVLDAKTVATQSRT